MAKTSIDSPVLQSGAALTEMIRCITYMGKLLMLLLLSYLSPITAHTVRGNENRKGKRTVSVVTRRKISSFSTAAS